MHGYEVVEVFTEEGESAKTAERTELLRMLSYLSAHKHQIAAVIAYKIDRIARNSDDYSQIRIKLKRYGVEIKSTSENFENTAAGRFMENMLANVAQFDNDVRTERSMGGMREAIREGRYVWTAPIGYTNLKIANKANIAPDQMAPLVLKTFYEVAKNQLPIEEIRKRMTKEGLCNKQGKPLSRSYFYTVLRNPLYAGQIIKFGEKHTGIFRPLVSEELFTQVQRVLKYRKHKTLQYKLDNPDFPLRRFIIHPKTGRRITGHWAKGRNNLYPYYRFHEPKAQYRRDSTEISFKAFLDSFKLDDRYYSTLRKSIRKQLGKQAKQGNEQREQLEKRITELKGKRNVLIEKNLVGIISNDLLQEQLELIEVGLRDAYSSMVSLSDNKLSDVSVALDEVRDYLKSPSEMWEKASFSSKIKLQWFYFPKGVLFDGVNCRTTEVCFLFKLKELLQDPLSSRAPSSVPTSNRAEIESPDMLGKLATEIVRLIEIENTDVVDIPP